MPATKPEQFHAGEHKEIEQQDVEASERVNDVLQHGDELEAHTPPKKPTPGGLQETIAHKEDIRRDPVGAFLAHVEKMDPNFTAGESADFDFSYLSPEQRAESLWALFQDIKGLWSGRKGSDEEQSERRTAIAPQLAMLRQLYEDKETVLAYRGAHARHLREVDSINGDKEKYEVLSQQRVEAQDVVDASAQLLYQKRGVGADEYEKLLFEVHAKRLGALSGELEELLRHNPELSALAQYETLRKYQRQMREEGFVWFSSRRELLDVIERAALSGKPLLLSGESGTGKTRLVEQAARVLTGRIHNETPGKDVRFADLIAKPKISPVGATYYEYKEIGEAVTGKKSTRAESPVHNGLVVADDEFNLLDESEQNTRISRVAAWTPGKRIKLPVTNEEVTVARDFLYAAMVNLASERYRRKKIPAEVLRKFAKVDVGFIEQGPDNPELYEGMLAALLDENGRFRAARQEAAPAYEYREDTETRMKDGVQVKTTVRTRELREFAEDVGGRTMPVGGFLWRFAQALNELNKSFSREKTVLESRGEEQYMRELIIDVGTVLSWMREYATLGREKSLGSFVVEKLNQEFLTKDAYPAEDRALAREFFAYYGIDADEAEVSEKEMPKFEILTPKEIGLLSPRVRYQEIVSEEPVLSESYYITEEGERIEYDIRLYVEVNDAGEETIIQPGDFIHMPPPEDKIMRFAGVRKDTEEPLFIPLDAKDQEVLDRVFRDEGDSD